MEGFEFRRMPIFLRKTPYVILITIVFSFAAGWLGKGLVISNVSPRSIPIRANVSYRFTAPLLFVDNSNPLYQDKELQKRIVNYISETKKNSDIQNLSVYFRDLKSTEWVGVNESDQYNPASLLKVPIMMAYFKMAEADPRVLSRRFMYIKTDPNDEFQTLKSNQSYTVEELIHAMIVNSDNKAKDILGAYIDKNVLKEMFNELKIQPLNNVDKYEISAKNYSFFFRILYNTTFLDRESSERALELLSKATFQNGIRAGVPADIPIAHKFGQYGIISNGILLGIELHDCGIVYYPGEHYLLCVMTRGGENRTTLEGVVQNISRLTYERMTQLTKKN